MKRMFVIHAAIVIAATLPMVACEPDTVVGPGPGSYVIDEGEGNDPDPAFASGETPPVEGWNDLGPEPQDDSCQTELDCLQDEECGGAGCDLDPCGDDRCVEGKCEASAIAGCAPGYDIEYSYAACCSTRTIRLTADGGCTFEVAGIGSRPCEYLDASYVRQVVDLAAGAGFFGWGEGACVPGETGSDFAIHLADGTNDSTVSCEKGVCTGALCHIIDRIWAAMPPHWQDGCGC